MFTGIIEETGRIKSLRYSGKILRMVINAKNILDDLKIGDSVAVNGICLTVVEKGRDCFGVDVLEETVSLSNFGSQKVADNVNLERAMKLSGRLSGHLVSGHIDGTVTVKSISKDRDSSRVFFTAAPSILKHIIRKGSVTLNGVSLTVFDAIRDTFSVNIIPHTLKETNLAKLKQGDKVNVETDLIGKYVEKHLANEDFDILAGDIKMGNVISDFIELSGGPSQCN